MFISEHLSKFKSCFPAPPTLALPEENEGRSPERWFKDIDPRQLTMRVGPLRPTTNRPELLAMATDRSVGTLELCISVLAWGGMHGKNRDLLFERPLEPWISIANRIRDDELSRSESYDAFAALRSSGNSAIVGMGPAYFTKLIYFLAPAASSRVAKGYIMDQWLGCAINLLTGRQVVKLDQHLTWKLKKNKPVLRADSFVSNLNTGQDYEAFCQLVEALSAELGTAWTPELTERALIAEGGRTPHPWRSHVVEQRLATMSIW
ncbi:MULTISPECIES: 8-oxoguanine DNA glycosylase OGG fold protein [Bradyrhizobium]|uniref:8-oxoguanine DNA glycosylase OGG fold protein n=1 Tax=Bradyrhizobium TaxID=374 RepID=UPI00155F2CF7|nr:MULTISPECIES: hypothetical protein [Bradyrhizobium]UUO32320.1 hypothetical protein DCG74_36820 [Bradyrhizobium sp. WBAH42]